MIPPHPRLIAITGASGLIGAALCAHFARVGWRVRALQRRPPPNRSIPGVEYFALDLPGSIPSEALHGCEAVIHAAYATRPTRNVDARLVNEIGSQRLIEAARSAGVPRFIFLSTLSARADAPSYYARSKFAVEQLLNPAKDLSIRPGLVLSLDAGLAGRLANAARRGALVPVFQGGRQPVQTIDVVDLCNAVSRAIEMQAAGVLHLAHPEPVTMIDFMREISRAVGGKLRPVGIPAWSVLMLVRSLEWAGIAPPVSSDTIRALLHVQHVDTRPDLQRLGVTLRDARHSFHLFASSGSRSPACAPNDGA